MWGSSWLPGWGRTNPPFPNREAPQDKSALVTDKPLDLPLSFFSAKCAEVVVSFTIAIVFFDIKGPRLTAGNVISWVHSTPPGNPGLPAGIPSVSGDLVFAQAIDSAHMPSSSPSSRVEGVGKQPPDGVITHSVTDSTLAPKAFLTQPWRVVTLQTP